MITSPKFDSSKVEPWKISPTGKVTRVAKPRANLNARQKRFVHTYLTHGNGTKAAIEAGYARSSAAVHAHRLLNHAKVQEKIRAQQERVKQSHEDTVEKTSRELGSIAFADPISLFDSKWNLLPPNKMPRHARIALDRLEVEVSAKGGVRTVYIKLADKIAALTALGNALGLFPKPPRAGR